MNITFYIGDPDDQGKIVSFDLEGYMSVKNLQIYDRLFAKDILMDKECRLTAGKLTDLFKYYLGGNGTLKEYMDHILEYGFFTPYDINLRMKVELDESEDLENAVL